MTLSLDDGEAQTLIYYSPTHALRGVVRVYPIASGSKGGKDGPISTYAYMLRTFRIFLVRLVSNISHSFIANG